MTIKVYSVLLFCLLSAQVQAGDVMVIVNKGNTNPIDRELIIKIYTGAAAGWPDGSPVTAFDQENDNPVRADFYKQIVGKSRAAIRAIRAQNIFSGRGLPPKLANPDAEMKKLVSSDKNAIGYIHASSMDDSVKAVKP